MWKHILYQLPYSIHFCLGSFGRGKANSIQGECGYDPFTTMTIENVQNNAENQ
jgi:hypothetical protein